MKVNILILLFTISVFHISCKKYLDQKSDQSLVVPSSIKDLQSLLDNVSRVNQMDPVAAERSCDNYYLTDDVFEGESPADQQAYIWGSNIFKTGNSNDWGYTYDNIYRANVVLDNIDKIEIRPDEQAAKDDLKGQAYFLRGKSFLQAAIIWSQAYDEGSGANALGIPLRVNSDFNIPTTRSTIKQTYDQIVSDFRNAAMLLPESSIHPVRPSKAAAFGFLARTFLAMRKYDDCFVYADLCLQLKSTLLDYDTYSPLSCSSNPSSVFTRFNAEVIYDAYMLAPGVLSRNKAKCDSVLYAMYADDDRRKDLFFNCNTGFRGHYSGTTTGFSGIAVDEVLLMRAECYARKGMTDSALADLNTLLQSRWKKSVPYPEITANDANEALDHILVERRKQLIMRGLRWMDVKRLNKEGANIVLKRVIKGETYVLPPNDPRYALPIPVDVVEMTGIKQN